MSNGNKTVMKLSHLGNTGMLHVVIYIRVCVFLCAHVLFYHKRLVTPSAHQGKNPVLVTQTSRLVSQLPCKHSRAQQGLGAACSPGHCSAVVF